jgi:hypothetical protein
VLPCIKYAHNNDDDDDDDDNNTTINYGKVTVDTVIWRSIL